MDNEAGITAGGIVYSDMNVEQIASVPDTAWHRGVDLVVQQADIDGTSNGLTIATCNKS